MLKTSLFCSIHQENTFKSCLHSNLIISTDFHSFTVNEKENFKISQFSRFLLRSEDGVQVKIWKWLKLLNSVPFIKKTLVNHVYIRIWSSWMTFTVLQWIKKNSKISQFSSFLLRSGYVILVKIWKWLKLLNSVPFIRKHLYIMFTFEFDHLDWLSQFYSEWRQTSKLVNFQVFC